jgi:hypothetical protein
LATTAESESSGTDSTAGGVTHTEGGAMRDKIIATGVKHLREFGYPTCTATNIISDPLYRAFFRSMVEGTLGEAGEGSAIGKACKGVLAEIAAADKSD